MIENIYAYTESTSPAGGYVGYVSVNQRDDGTVTLTVRSSGAGVEGTLELPTEVQASLAKVLAAAGPVV